MTRIDADLPGDAGPIAVVFVPNHAAIVPMYGAIGVDFCALEAGYMSELVAMAAASIGVTVGCVVERGTKDVTPGQVLADPLERAQFKLEQRGRRQADRADTVTALGMAGFEDAERDAMLARQSYRAFATQPLPSGVLTDCLSAIGAGALAGAGCALRSNPIGLQASPTGSILYDTATDILMRTHAYSDLASIYGEPGDENRQIFDAGAFAVFIIASSDKDSHDRLVAAGRVGQRMMERSAADLVGFCPIGDVLVPAGDERLGLGAVERVIHSFVGGAISREQTERWMGVAVRSAAVIATLRGHLSHKLPHYMVPPRIVEIDALPLTANGKVDRQALQARVERTAMAASGPAAGMTETESLIARSWAELLGRPSSTCTKASSSLAATPCSPHASSRGFAMSMTLPSRCATSSSARPCRSWPAAWIEYGSPPPCSGSPRRDRKKVSPRV